MTIKLITTEDYGWEELPVSLFRPYSRGIEHPRGVKVASALAHQLEELVPEKGHTLVHTLAVGSTERYGPNRNGDGFRRDENKLAHDRFVKFGHVYKHHQNKDPTKASGQIKLSAYNDDMDRIELVISLDNEKCRDEIQKLAEGKDLPGSMGCHVAFDVCLAPDTYVLTPDGPRQMRDLVVGDLVISHTGAARAITHVYVQSHERSSKVIRSWGAVDALHATDNHPIYVLSAGEATANQRQYRRKQLGGSDRVVGVVGYSAPAFVPASDVAEDDFLLYPVVRGSKQPTIDPWIAGLALGDGSVFGTRRGRKRDGEWRAYGIQFSLGLDKYEIVEHLLRRASDLGYSAKVYPEPGKAAVSVHVHSRHLAEEFSRLFGRSHDKHLSGEVLQWHPSALRSLIGGWLDADGSQDGKKGSVRGVTVLPAVARGIWQAAVSAGVPCAAHWENVTGEWAVSEKACMLHFQAAHTLVLSEHSVHIQSVQRRAKNLCFYFEHEGVEYLAMPVHSIESSTIDRTLNFGVERDESYVASFAAVHNCSICGHQAPTPQQYCEHAKTAMTRILDDGRQVYVDNPDPGYFDWSLVGRPADRIAFSTTLKVASFDSPITFSADLAKMAGLYLPDSYVQEERRSVKLALLSKLAAMEKEIEANLSPIDESIGKATHSEDDELSKPEARRLKGQGIGRVMESLHNAQVILPVRDFLRLISADREDDLSEFTEQVQGQLPGIFSNLAREPEAVDDDLFDGDGQGLPDGFASMLNRLTGSFGLGEQPLGRRVTITIIRGQPKTARATKLASDDPAVQGLARLYATYKLAALAHPANQADQALSRALVLQNYYHP